MTLLVCGLAGMATAAPAVKIRTETVDYKDGGYALRGYLAYNERAKGKAPGVLVVHDWMGTGPYTEGRARQLAELGYVALAVDIYGTDVHPQNPQQAGEQAGKYRADRALMRSRVAAGLKVLQEHPRVDAGRIAAMGYCFGGGVALELARSGAPIIGTISFHGNLDTPNPADAKNIKGKILVLHGADDPFVKPDQVAAFETEMRDAKVDWQLVSYGNAVHAFTHPSAGNDNSRGAAYNEKADKRSWEAMKTFFDEVFAR